MELDNSNSSSSLWNATEAALTPPPTDPPPMRSKPLHASLTAERSAIESTDGSQPASESRVLWMSPEWLRRISSFLISFIVHALLLIGLAFLLVPSDERPPIQLVAQPRVDLDEQFSLLPDQLEQATPTPLDTLQTADEDLTSPQIPDLMTIGGPSLAAAPDLQPQWLEPAAGHSLLSPSFAPVGGGLEGRDPEMRRRLARRNGGSDASENAVELGLAWLAAHQRPDGSWRFNHLESNCDGSCGHPGSAATTTGATAIALLPFLGAGYSSQHGPYQDVVKRGLYYLNSRMLLTTEGGDLQEGTMYAQGLAAIALCEGYALSQDPTLGSSAQHAIDFICRAQHSQGGWRYVPGQPGDTTVFGWQIMSLKSARLANLDVPSPVIDLAMHYLDTVQDSGGATYGYLKPGKEPAPTAIGLLARMYHGWRYNDERLIRGVVYLDSLGPSKHDVYFNYYATQVMHHYGTPYWNRWNNRLREHLIRTQARRGHAQGSWYFEDRHGKTGGRLYTTAMCIMTLEVYYRHMPLYGNRSVNEGW